MIPMEFISLKPRAPSTVVTVI